MTQRNLSAFEDISIPVRVKLFALWSFILFFYIYGDYFEFYQPGKLPDMIAGKTAFGHLSQGILLGMASLMIIPSLMPFLTIALPAGINRWMNIVFGTIYTLIMVLAIQGGWRFYILYGLIEIALTSLVVWYAWTWPKQPARS